MNERSRRTNGQAPDRLAALGMAYGIALDQFEKSLQKVQLLFSPF
jgi:hypothetical protein